MNQHFAVIYTYGSAEEQARHRPEHRTYLATLVEQGSLLASGPFTDDGDPGALLIFSAKDSQSVATLIEQDPMRRHGVVLDYRIRPWNPVLGSVGETQG